MQMVLAASAALGLTINHSTFLCTQVNEPLMTSVAGNLKNVLMVRCHVPSSGHQPVNHSFAVPSVEGAADPHLLWRVQLKIALWSVRIGVAACHSSERALGAADSGGGGRLPRLSVQRPKRAGAGPQHDWGSVVCHAVRHEGAPLHFHPNSACSGKMACNICVAHMQHVCCADLINLWNSGWPPSE